MIRYEPTKLLHLLSGFRDIYPGWWQALGEESAATAIVSATASDGLVMVLRALHKRGQVIVPAYTCARVVSAIIEAGDDPCFVDIDIGTGSFLKGDLERALDQEPKAVLLTHLFGCDLNSDLIFKLAAKRSVPIIEDRALWLGLGSSQQSRGFATFYSFGRGKPLSLGGGGVVVVTDNMLGASLTEQAEQYATNTSYGLGTLLLGAVRGGLPALVLSELVGRLGISQRDLSSNRVGLARFQVGSPNPQFVRSVAVGIQELYSRTADVSSRTISDRYAKAFNRAKVRVNGQIGHRIPYDSRTPALAFITPDRDGIVAKLSKVGIDSPRYWQYSAAEVFGESGFPFARQLAQELLFLPLHSLVTDTAIARVARLLEGYHLTAFN